jgi:DNA polymerase-1
MNVVYGFFRILFKLMMNKPEYMLITWDLPVATKRYEMDTEYKANRPETPDDFKQQIPVVHDIVKQLGIPGF